VKQIDFILYELQRRAKQKEEGRMLNKMKSAEPGNPALSKKEIELNNQNITTSQVVM